MLLYRVTAALNRARVPYALVGGFAVALHGVVRGTVDIDLILRFRERDFERAAGAFASIGLSPRLPVTPQEVFRFREEYIAHRNMTAWTFVNPASPGEIVDVILTHDLTGAKVKRMRIDGHPVSVLARDELVRMKTKSGRPQDLIDAEALRKLP